MGLMPVRLDTLDEGPARGLMIRVLFYRVVLSVTASILLFIVGALNIESFTPWLKHYSMRRRKTDK